MASHLNNGSPQNSRMPTSSFNAFQDDQKESRVTGQALMTGPSASLEHMLNRLKLNESRQTSASYEKVSPSDPSLDSLESRLNELNEQTLKLKRQEADLRRRARAEAVPVGDQDRSSSSGPLTPPSDGSETQNEVGSGELERLKKELEAAKSLISRQENELEESRTLKHTIDQTLGSASDNDFTRGRPGPGHLNRFNASARPFASRTSAWVSGDGQIEALPTGHLGSAGGALNRYSSRVPVAETHPSQHSPVGSHDKDSRSQVPDWRLIYGGNTDTPWPGQRNVSNSSIGTFGSGIDERLNADASHIVHLGPRRNAGALRSSTSHFTDPLSPISIYSQASGHQVSSANVYGAAQPFNKDLGVIGAPIPEYSTGLPSGPPIYAPASPPPQQQAFVTQLEPTNYRRLLDKSVSCDWKNIVEKIVCNNDQQASIFLQQKLKIGTAEQKYEIVEAIIRQAYPLMINRFGNFLIQRCFEHGTPEQVIAIADAIHGNVLSLSMDPFGCHVIQKAFDSIPESHKANMIRELLRRIPDTVIHRYACHVWQKLFELRWSDQPPQIMTKVNEALAGMWHEVALGETGSLVVQNIFENCVEEEKRPAIEEVIASIDLIAHGQFGNWCIQHLCEHGSPPDKRRVIDHILANSYSYSIDQFASKVVEKCLKIGGGDFLERYLGVITTSLPDRPRIPLIDIAGDQYGNYLVQWILMNAPQHQRDQVGVHIRKHMVSLRGSKFGSRVAMLCSNPASTTRPGPAAVVNPYGAPGQPRPQWQRFR